jgi:hypothetical protein
MKTIKELADIGAAAAFNSDRQCQHYLCVSGKSHSWECDRPARQAFAAAVRDAVLADLVTKTDSSPVTKTVPLDIDDIRATDEFRHINGAAIQVLHSWCDDSVMLMLGGRIGYTTLSQDFLRRQHGSNEWKPCTKEEVK